MHKLRYIPVRKTTNYWWIETSINIIIEYQKISNLIDSASNQPYKLKTKHWIEINDESRGVYNVNSQIKV